MVSAVLLIVLLYVSALAVSSLGDLIKSCYNAVGTSGAVTSAFAPGE